MKNLLAFTAVLAAGILLGSRRAAKPLDQLIAEVKTKAKGVYGADLAHPDTAFFVGDEADIKQIKAIASTFKGKRNQ